MKFSLIMSTLNQRLAGELLDLEDAVSFLDSSIDSINTRLNTCFPTFSELAATDPNASVYDAIPDKYLRTVVIPGAAFNFYTMDEEGADVAPKFEQEFQTNLFYMERDYLELVPEEYVADEKQGTFSFDYERDGNRRGLSIDGSYFTI